MITMRYQRTLKRELFIHGVGLHTGKSINMRIKPAPRNTGIVFVRSDKGYREIEAGVNSVADTMFATNLSYDGVRVGTVEHILSALAGLKIDNAYIELDGPEVPIMDGSAIYFVHKFLEAGIARQAEKVSYLRIIKPVILREGPCQIAVVPNDGLKISCSVNYNHPLFMEQTMNIELTSERFIREIAPARTFGFLRDVKMLRTRGLAKGGSLKNAIVVGDNGVINKGELRFKDEFVRHKILDVIGDISLLRYPVCGHIIVQRPGHSLNIKFLRKVLISADCWEIVSSATPVTLKQEITTQV
jgi:UDP-3-O-[3-hydroxymyristoyl] N-acetylglucosamine deacetylase